MPREPATGLVGTVREAIRTAVAADLDRLAGEPDTDAAAALLADARHAVWALGGRFSAVLAEYLVLHLQVLRRGVHRVPGDPGGRHTALLDVARRDVVVAFDYRRYQRDTVEFGRRAVAQGARLVLFTDHLLSPLAGDADVVLVTTIDTGSPFSVMSPGLAAVETVLVTVVDRLGGAPQSRMERYDELATEVLPARAPGGGPDAGTAAADTPNRRTR
jgi:DNA-binding MurR/RpiR family transcriptional regulator